MAVLVFLVLLLSLTGHSSASYCLCKDGVGDQALQKAIDYACGNGADCTPIVQNAPCYQPNTVKDHCNYAVNSYYQKKSQATGSCDFSGAATVSANPPTTAASGCSYPSSPGNTGTGTSTPTTTPTTGGSTAPPTGTSPSTTPTTGTTTPTTGTTTPTTGTTTPTTGTTPTPSVFGTGSTGLGPTGSGTGFTDPNGGVARISGKSTEN
ncbi:Glucan endo-1 3-beta-glucosidase-like protein [Tripterygium wilfordii]|uniref:Glucan endo-1 3-beta-glucosidase-like protein n=1 Tax=Tripterygium wilfordii TaxID=458696 RepID=A0A7J7DHB7_TRIWF|nr:Glucan endo-1 3-beta-glucosidase-like protein [Tripterygium wilfordii]